MAEPKYYDELPTYIMHSDGEFKEGVFKAVDGSGNSLTIGTEKSDTEGKLSIEGAEKAEFESTFETGTVETEEFKGASFLATISGIGFQVVGTIMTMGELVSEGLALTFKKDDNTISFTLPSLNTLAEMLDGAIARFVPKNIKDGTGTGAIAEGLVGSDVPAESRNEASGAYSHAEGGYAYENNGTTVYMKSVASGISAHAESNGQATGNFSHAEGAGQASGEASHAESRSQATGKYSHSEGTGQASADFSHAEGYSSKATGPYSHAEGNMSQAKARESHAEGSNTIADGLYSHSQNEYTIAKGKSQTVIGKFNAEQGTNDSSTNTDYAFIIGNGTGMSAANRSNALAVRWDGAIVLANGTVLTVEQLAKVANLT